MVGDVTGMTDHPKREGSKRQTVVDDYMTDGERSSERASPESIVTKNHR